MDVLLVSLEIVRCCKAFRVGAILDPALERPTMCRRMLPTKSQFARNKNSSVHARVPHFSSALFLNVLPHWRHTRGWLFSDAYPESVPSTWTFTCPGRSRITVCDSVDVVEKAMELLIPVQGSANALSATRRCTNSSLYWNACSLSNP